MASKLIKKMSNDINLSQSDIQKIILSAPYRYKVYPIRKKKPGEFRIIAQPAREVKLLQYWLMANSLNNLPVHSAAAAYIPKRNILNNAEKHSKNQFILKMDFTNFFPSIKPNDFRVYLERQNRKLFEREDLDHVIRILFWKPKKAKEFQLSIGAPSSPHISNLVMYDFDEEAEKLCNANDIVYTRYADDLTFSTNEPYRLRHIHGSVKEVCRKIDHPKLFINTEKTFFSSKRNRRRITGLIISNDERVSLGRERKRLIRAKIHKFVLGKLDKEEIEKLRGLLAFSNDVEPEFIKRMKAKYSEETITTILKMPWLKGKD